MPDVSDLLPELRAWNSGAGIAPNDWIYIAGRADHALGYCALMWPNLVAFEGYVLLAPLNVELLRIWERAGHARPQIETAMNAYLFDHIFPDDPTKPELKSAQLGRLALIMVDMLAAKLKREFPQQNFEAFVLDEDDFGVSFHQV